MSILRRRFRRQGTFGREGACERRHRYSPRARRTDDARRAHDVARPPRLRGATRDRRLQPLSGAMARGVMPCGRTLLDSGLHRIPLSTVRGISRRRRVDTAISVCRQDRSHVAPVRRARGSGNGHRHALGVDWPGLDERPADLWERTIRLKVRVRRYAGVNGASPPPFDDCQGEVCVGSRGMRSRMRRIFPIFHNSMVKTSRFRWCRFPQGLDEHEGHGQDVPGMPTPSHTSRECG